MILRANCKINLGLDILCRRADGYHDLETVMFPVRGLYDDVEVVRTDAPGVAFRAEGLAVDCAAEDNICLKAFRLMHDRYGVDGVRIRLVKRVPFGAGLGGGSSDATAVVLALDELFALGRSEKERIARCVLGKVVDLSCQKYSSNVIEKILLYAPESVRSEVVMELAECPNLRNILHHDVGDTVETL